MNADRVLPEHEDDPANVIAALRGMLKVAEAEVIERERELDAARLRVAIAREAHVAAVAKARNLGRALSALEAPVNKAGRPRGSDPAKTRGRLLELLPTRPVWRPVELRDALHEQEHPASIYEVTSALSAMARSGDAVRVAKGQWRAPESFPLGEVPPPPSPPA